MNSKVERSSLFGSVISGFMASICCIGPVVFALLGVSGAAFVQKFESYRPVFVGVAVVLLGIAHYLAYKKKPAESCEPGTYCANPKSEKINKLVLWIATILVFFFILFPAISAKIL